MEAKEANPGVCKDVQRLSRENFLEPGPDFSAGQLPASMSSLCSRQCSSTACAQGPVYAVRTMKQVVNGAEASGLSLGSILAPASTSCVTLSSEPTSLVPSGVIWAQGYDHPTHGVAEGIELSYRLQKLLPHSRCPTSLDTSNPLLKDERTRHLQDPKG